MLGYVDSAIGRVRAITHAEGQFAKAHPDLGYTCELSGLPPSEEISRLLAKGRIDNGYMFEITGCQAGHKPNPTYAVTARPLHVGLSAYCSNQSEILWSDDDGSVEKCLANRKPYM